MGSGSSRPAASFSRTWRLVNPRSRNDPLMTVAGHFAVEPAVGSPAEESQHILRIHLLHRMIDQIRIDRLEPRGVLEHHIRGIFALPDAPVIATQVQTSAPAGQRIHTPR